MLTLVSVLVLVVSGHLHTGPFPVPGRLGRGHPVPEHHHHHHYGHCLHAPVVRDHLLALPPGALPQLPLAGRPVVVTTRAPGLRLPKVLGLLRLLFIIIFIIITSYRKVCILIGRFIPWTWCQSRGRQVWGLQGNSGTSSSSQNWRMAAWTTTSLLS